MKKPLVHIILVNYNGTEDTIVCINSIKLSSYMNIVIDVVDNDSEQDSLKKLKTQFADDEYVNLIFNSSNVGFAAANNIGIKYAKDDNAEVIVLLNNDTVIESETIANLVAVVSGEKRSVFTGKILYHSKPDTIWYAGGLYDFYKGTTHHIGCNRLDSKKYDIERNVGFASGCYLAFRTSDIDIIGLLPEEYFLYSEDVDYSLHIINAGYSILYIPQSRVYHKVSASVQKQSGLANYYMQRNRLKVIKKYHHGLKKISAYCYTMLVFIKACAKGSTNIDSVLRSFRDFRKGVEGKTY